MHEVGVCVKQEDEEFRLLHAVGFHRTSTQTSHIAPPKKIQLLMHKVDVCKTGRSEVLVRFIEFSKNFNT